NRKIDLFANADDPGGKSTAAGFQLSPRLRVLLVRRGENDAHAIRAFHDVIVGNDVAVRLDDDARAEAAFAPHRTRAAVVLVRGGSVAAHQDLNDGGRDALDERFERGAHLPRDVRGGRSVGDLAQRTCG